MLMLMLISQQAGKPLQVPISKVEDSSNKFTSQYRTHGCETSFDLSCFDSFHFDLK
jgi:hypothetical protein